MHRFFRIVGKVHVYKKIQRQTYFFFKYLQASDNLQFI